MTLINKKEPVFCGSLNSGNGCAVLNLADDILILSKFESERLEGEAVKLYRKGKLFFDANAKKFFRDVANFNQWENLKKELDK